MGLPAHKATFAADDYLAWESAQLDRHEYLNGEVTADQLFADVVEP